MSRVQCSFFNTENLLEPAAFISLAFFVGSTRMIEFFPRTTRSGLLMSAGLTSTASRLYDCTLHDPDQNLSSTLLGKAGVIAFAALCTSLVAKPQEYAYISYVGAAKFGALQFVVAAIIAKAIEEVPQPPPPDQLQREHRHFQLEPIAWKRLSDAERAEKIVAFMNAGLHMGSLRYCDSPETYKLFKEGKERWKTFTSAQLSWCSHIFSLDSTTSWEDEMFYFALCLERGVDDVDPPYHSLWKLYRGKQKETDLFYQYLQKTPQHFHCLPEELREEIFQKLFVGKALIPKVDAQLSADKIATMGFHSFRNWWICMSKEGHWGEASLETRTVFLKHFIVSYGPSIVDWDDWTKLTSAEVHKGVRIQEIIGDMTPEDIRNLEDGVVLKMYHDIMLEEINKDSLNAQLTAEQLSAFNKKFSQVHYTQV